MNLWPDIEQRAAQVTASCDVALPGGIALAGAGFAGQLAGEYLQQSGIKAVCFGDNSPAKQGGAHAGIPVVSMEELARRKPAVTLITARHTVTPVAKQLEKLGVAALPFDAFFISRHLSRLQAVRNELLVDDRSRHVFDSILLAMLANDRGYCRAVMEDNQYFALPEFSNIGNIRPVHFVDAGAFAGDSVERFLWSNFGIFSRIYAFEPGPKQFAAMKIRMQRLAAEWAFGEEAYECVQAGLGDQEEEKVLSIPYALQSGIFLPQSHQGDGISIVTLDRYLNGRPVTFLKADIEGMEMAMLKGAAQSIRQYTPHLAISVYHRNDDLFTIPEYIHSLVPAYRMALRHHSPTLMESVLYCWVEDNL